MYIWLFVFDIMIPHIDVDERKDGSMGWMDGGDGRMNG
jgi:hypothetical protein